ncbi:T9SS sorting signal type C domain-containing protein [Formosa sp. A9]|uniref:T9SS sorting signal type C domain-containing protein n=1 Tax=Formosa sp. A9 TaxID=3442641 RepID=UPI003EBD6831
MYIKTITTRSILNIAPLKTYYCLIILCLFSFSSFGQTTKTWSPSGLFGFSWNTAANWSPWGVPTINDDVIISYYIYAPIINNFDAQAKSVKIDKTSAWLPIIGSFYYRARLEISNTGSLTVSGSITNDGYLNVNNGRVTTTSGDLLNAFETNISSSSQLNITGNITNEIYGSVAAFTVDNSTITVSGNFRNTENLTVDNSSSATINGDLVNIYGYDSNAATLNIDDSNLSATNISNSDSGSTMEINGSTVQVTNQFTNLQELTVNDSDVTVNQKFNSGYSTTFTNSDLTATNFENYYLQNLTVEDNSTINVSSSFTSDGYINVSNSIFNVNTIDFLYNGEANFSNGSLINATNTIYSASEFHLSNSNIQSSYVALTFNSTFTLKDNCKVTVENDINADGTVILEDIVQIETKNLYMAEENGRSQWNLFDDSYLMVHEHLDLQAKLNIFNNASLIQTSTTDLNDVAENYHGQLNINRIAQNIENHDYVYWSAPVMSYNLDGISTSTNRYIWEPTTNGGQFGNWSKVSNTPMQLGKGYIVKGGPSGHTSGENYTTNFSMYLRGSNRIPNGTIPVTVSRGTYNDEDYYGPSNTTKVTKYDDNWNLIGNPYPSAISADAFLTANSGSLYTNEEGDVSVDGGIIEGGLRIWTHGSAPSSTYNDPFYANETYSYNPNDYITYTLAGSSDPSGFSGYIASCQGFFVLMRQDTPSQSETLNFTNAMRTHTSEYTNAEFFRTENTKNRIWLNLKNSKDIATNMLLGYFDGAVNAKDPLYDAIIMDPNTTSIYSLIDNEGFVVQGKANPFTNTDTVPLGVIIKEKDVYSIGISAVDGLFETTNQDIYLEDLYENKVHDLRTAPYQFSSEVGTFNDRFVLVYEANKLGIDETTTLNDLNIFATKNYIKVSSKTNVVNTITIYDILGRALFNTKNLNTQEVLLDQFAPTNSPLIIKATLANGKTKTQKVIY